MRATSRIRRFGGFPAAIVIRLCLIAAVAEAASADFTRNIMITGYWPPTNEMVRHFSTNADQNPGGWQGGNWHGRGYDVYSFFPEFPGGVITKGEGDFEVDYQDTSSDFWRIVGELKPIAIITFSRGQRSSTRWEIEAFQRNLDVWEDDYLEPFQPTPAPPDDSVPAGFVRSSSLPMSDIESAIDNAGLGLNANISENYGGGFLSEFIAYHGTWYRDIHADPSDPAWCIAGGHIHVGSLMPLDTAIAATEITLDVVIDYVDSKIPEPASGLMLMVLCAAAGRRRWS